MIQLKRGSTSSWKSQSTPLADGQPGYDKDRQKLKIGDGKTSWEKLPDASGLRMEEILESEAAAQKKAEAKNALSLLNPAAALISKVLKLEDRPVFTYGTEDPNEGTVGQVYLQQYEAEPEMDYIVAKGTSKGWYFQKYHSGFARICGSFDITTGVQSAFENTSLYCSNTDFDSREYPFTFTRIPTEVASLTSIGNIVWLAGKNANSTGKTGSYTLISPDSKGSADYKLHFEVTGYWREPAGGTDE